MIGGECVTVGDNAKDCLVDCLNPLNWGGKGAGARGVKDKTGKQKDGAPRNNQAQNKQARDAANAAGGLDANQQRQLHDAISGQDYSYQEILNVAKDIKNGRY